MLGTLPTSVSGTVRDGKVSMKIGVTVAALGQTVDVAFEGDKMSGNESGEAKILSFTFDLENEANACVIGHPVINEDNTITFDVDQAMVDANPDLLKGLVPTFAYSEKATCVLQSGVAIDFFFGCGYYDCSREWNFGRVCGKDSCESNYFCIGFWIRGLGICGR